MTELAVTTKPVTQPRLRTLQLGSILSRVFRLCQSSTAKVRYIETSEAKCCLPRKQHRRKPAQSGEQQKKPHYGPNGRKFAARVLHRIAIKQRKQPQLPNAPNPYHLELRLRKEELKHKLANKRITRQQIIEALREQQGHNGSRPKTSPVLSNHQQQGHFVNSAVTVVLQPVTTSHQQAADSERGRSDYKRQQVWNPPELRYQPTRGVKYSSPGIAWYYTPHRWEAAASCDSQNEFEEGEIIPRIPLGYIDWLSDRESSA